MLTRKFSRREKTLLLLFIVMLLGCLYYLLIDQPVRSAIFDANSRQTVAENELVVSNTMLEEKLWMQEALDQLSSDTDAIVPDYDNARRVVELLNGAMLQTESYNMTFQPLVTNERIVSRSINISFICSSYDVAKNIISMLHDGPYRCEISAVSMALTTTARQVAQPVTADGQPAPEASPAVYIPSLKNSGLNVSLSATFYEFIP